jgi:membrane protein
MTRSRLKRALLATGGDILHHHTFQIAAALSYYFVLAVFPGLILLSAAMRALPYDLFAHVLDLMLRLLPTDTVSMVESILLSVSSQRRTWISVGTLGILWVASAAFDALIEALDMAYDVDDPRPLWKSRLLALGLGAISSVFLIAALVAMILGPRLIGWLAFRIYLPHAFVFVWPFARWFFAIGFAVLIVEVIYFLAPNTKQRFFATLPGSLLAVGSWLGLSYLLGIYFRHFANYDRIYGTLGAFIVFMTWLYWASFVLLVGAELNAELAKASEHDSPPTRNEITAPDHAESAA